MRIRGFVLFISSVIMTSVIAADKPQEVDTSAVEQTVNTVCAACHAADGNSAIAINPKLAGQHAGYLLKQLRNFKDGSRENAVMGGMVANLSPEDMQGLAAYYASQPAKLAKAKTDGAGSLGEKIYRGGIAETNVPACAACHGANGKGMPKRFLVYPRNTLNIRFSN